MVRSGFVSCPFPVAPSAWLRKRPFSPAFRRAAQRPTFRNRIPSASLQTEQCLSPAQVAAFFESHGVSREAAIRASRLSRLQRAGNLEARGRRVLEALSELGLSTKQVTRTLTHFPDVVLHAPTEFVPRLTFLQENAIVPFDLIPRTVARCPRLLVMSLQRAQNVLDVINTSFGGELHPADVGDVLSRVPLVLLRPPSALKRNLAWLSDKAHLSQPTTLSRVIFEEPLVLMFDISTNLNRRIEYFEKLGISSVTAGKLAAAAPKRVFGRIVEQEFKTSVDVISGIVGEHNLGGVVEKVPTVLLTDNLMERVDWLRDIVGLNDEQMSKVVQEAPAVLVFSVSGNLAPKWAFFTGTMGGTVNDLVQAPKEVLCANLQQRAVPRYAFIASNGIEGIPVVEMLKGSDQEFCERIKCEYPKFREYVDTDQYLLYFSVLI